MKSCTLRVGGVANPFSVDLSPRTVIEGPNGSGKTTIGRCLEMALTGRVSSLGGVPGVLPKLLSQNGLIETFAHVQVNDSTEERIHLSIRSGATKPDRHEGGGHYAVRSGRLPVKGSPEELRAFLAAQLEATVAATHGGAVYTPPESVGALKHSKDMTSPIRALDLELEGQREISKKRRAEVASAQQQLAGIPAPKTPRWTDSMSFQMAQLIEERANLQRDTADANADARIQAARNIDNARKSIEQMEKNPPAGPPNDVPTDQEIKDLEDQFREERERLTENNVRRDELKENQSALINSADSISDRVQRLEPLVRDGGHCSLCERLLDEESRDAIQANIIRLRKEFRSLEVSIQSIRKEIESIDCDESKMDQLSRSIQDAKTKKEIAERQAPAIRKAREEYDARLLRAQRILENAIALSEKIPPAPIPREDAKTRVEQINALLKSLEENREGETQHKRIEQINNSLAASEEALTESTNREAAIRKVRDELLTDALDRATLALRAFTRALPAGPAEPLIDVGDAANKVPPFLGIVRGTDRISVDAMSDGEATGFLALLSAALLESSPAPPERRVLILDAPSVVGSARDALLNALATRSIGMIIVEFPHAHPSRMSQWSDWSKLVCPIEPKTVTVTATEDDSPGEDQSDEPSSNATRTRPQARRRRT